MSAISSLWSRFFRTNNDALHTGDDDISFPRALETFWSANVPDCVPIVVEKWLFRYERGIFVFDEPD